MRDGRGVGECVVVVMMMAVVVVVVEGSGSPFGAARAPLALSGGRQKSVVQPPSSRRSQHCDNGQMYRALLDL